MAVSVLDGTRTDWPGAREDLEHGVLRVLHDRSFVDDPTRMLRLVRYAARLEFAPDPGTRGADRPARCARRSPATASATSCGWRCASRRPALRLLERYGLGRALLGEGFEEPWLAERAGPGLLALAACCLRVPRDELAARLDHLGFMGRTGM